MVQLSQKLEQLVNQTGGEVLKAILEQADKAIYAASKPEHRYQVKAHRSRTLTTLWGEVTFTRTYYQDKTDSSYHYLLDEWLGLDKSTHIEPFCRARLVTRSADVSYRKSVALTTPARLSGQSVLQSIRKLEAYARKQFTAHRQTRKPEVNQEILKKEWSRRKLPYCTYVPDEAAHMPGRESTLNGNGCDS